MAESVSHPGTKAAGRPVDLARKWQGRAGLIFLDTDENLQKGLSILAVEPQDVLRGNIFENASELRQILAQHRTEFLTALNVPSGGLFGWIDFDGNYVFGVYPTCHVYDHAAQTWLEGGDEAEATFENRPANVPFSVEFTPQIDRETFCDRVRKAQAYIAAGDIYQVNLSYPWLAHWPAERKTWTFYEQLRQVSPAPYSAFLSLDGLEIASASPECFLKISGNHIVTRPIKGTRPRGETLLADEILAEELKNSSKERAELVMITDLERNDLGQVCEFGSVHVSDLLRLEHYAQVQHLVSTVEGSLRAGIDHVAALQACFPGGSITGAPKKRATEIIHELELHPRELYTGAIGYLGFNGESQFSIAIRTAWKDGETMRFDTGAGIVADSVPEQEWEETRHKAAGLLAAAREM